MLKLSVTPPPSQLNLSEQVFAARLPVGEPHVVRRADRLSRLASAEEGDCFAFRWYVSLSPLIPRLRQLEVRVLRGRCLAALFQKNPFKRSGSTLLTVRLAGEEVARLGPHPLPIEVKLSRLVASGMTVEFEDSVGAFHRHDLGDVSGWAHFSIRLQANLACQADCVISKSQTYDSRQFLSGQGIGVRFQPFFISGATVDLNALRGHGLFARGLHFSGTVTPSSVRLSCECDACRHSFTIQSFHTGFGGIAYFYSASGRYTLIVDAEVDGAPAALSAPDFARLGALEAQFPPAPDGTAFNYLNPFRCPHCGDPYIDFAAHPEERVTEYYGNHFLGVDTIRFVSAPTSLTPP